MIHLFFFGINYVCNLLYVKCKNNNQNKAIWVFILIIGFGFSQGFVSSNSVSSNIKIYLDCHDCSFSFFRRNLDYVDFVRDPKLADLHIFVTEQRTASGSTDYGLNFIGNNFYSDIAYRLSVISPNYETDLLKWEKLLKTIEIGILPYISRTNKIDEITIEHESTQGVQSIDSFNDHWDYWVFRVGLSTRFSAEESQKEYSLRSSINANRITDLSKFRSNLSYNFINESYTDENDLIINKKVDAQLNADLIISLDPRWSAGIITNLSKSSFLNMSLSSRIGAAIEYNIFPWDKSDRKIFTIAYQISSNYFNYEEMTIYNMTNEWRVSESLKLSYILRQPWGEIENALTASHYFFDFQKNRLSLNSHFSINIIRGLSFYIHLNSELIHDQLYLPAGEATREELLLQQRQLDTDYEIHGNVGIRLTFGSVYNNIVNQRL